MTSERQKIYHNRGLQEAIVNNSSNSQQSLAKQERRPKHGQQQNTSVLHNDQTKRATTWLHGTAVMPP